MAFPVRLTSWFHSTTLEACWYSEKFNLQLFYCQIKNIEKSLEKSLTVFQKIKKKITKKIKTYIR